MLSDIFRILLIDGQRPFRRMVSQMLGFSGQNIVYQGSDLNAAWEILPSQPVDVVLCDGSRPESDGMELLRQLRSSDITRYLPVLLIAGKNQLEVEDFALGKDYEVDDYLFKPFNQDELLAKVASAMESHEAIKEEITHIARAGAFIDIQMLDEARDELETLRKIAPESPRIWSHTAKLYESMDSMADAKSCYEQAVSLDEAYAMPYGGLGDLFSKEGEMEKAGGCYERAATISPRNSVHQLSYAKILLTKGSKEEARNAVHHAMKYEASTDAKGAAAEFFLVAGYPEMAEDEYASALEKDPKNIHFYNQLGIALRRQKKWKEAHRTYKKALSISPQHPVITYNMARLLAEAGKFAQAKATLHDALTIDPHFEEAKLFLERLNKRTSKAA